MPINNSALSILDPRREEMRYVNETSRRSFTYIPKIPKVKFSLGWELEANHGAVRSPEGVQIHNDGSVDGESIEYVVMPTIVKSLSYTLGLLKELVHAPQLNTNPSCGFHVHISPQIKSRKVKRQWAIVCQMLAKEIEEEAFKAVPDSRQSNQYCKKIDLNKRMYFASTKYNNPNRYEWLNIVEMFRPNGIETIEVRLLGNTHRWKYLLAWSVFSLALAKAGWEVLHNPQLKNTVVSTLRYILSNITEQIKPLEKRHELIPEWVYEYARKYGIDTAKWNRPLEKLVTAECEILGKSKKYYNDNQATIEIEIENNVCEHGIDLENESCEDCDHANGNCDPEYCSNCRRNAHRNGELCENRNCSNCAEIRSLQNSEVQ